MSKQEHIIVVAFTVFADSRAQAQKSLMPSLRRGPCQGQLWEEGSDYIDSWWIAEDDREDGSDCDSAVFVPKGTQAQWQRAVKAYGDLQP